MLTQSALCLLKVAVQLYHLTSTIKVRIQGLRGTRLLKCLSHEASSASSAPVHVRLQAIAGFQAVNVLRIAPHQPSALSQCSDKFMTPARIDQPFDLLAQRGNEFVEHDGCGRVLPNTCVE